ncbi:hypothetical protein ABPG75_002904 [Micractinium tetrahymenae]
MSDGSSRATHRSCRTTWDAQQRQRQHSCTPHSKSFHRSVHSRCTLPVSPRFSLRPPLDMEASQQQQEQRRGQMPGSLGRQLAEEEMGLPAQPTSETYSGTDDAPTPTLNVDPVRQNVAYVYPSAQDAAVDSLARLWCQWGNG